MTTAARIRGRRAADVALWLSSAALLAYACFRLVTTHTIAPPRRDEVEFLHTAWLIRSGLRPFDDFLQHHSPVFMHGLALLAQPGTRLDWVYVTRALAAMSAVVSALLFSFIATGPYRAARFGVPARLCASATFLLLLVTISAPQIRPETFAVTFFLAAWTALEGSPSGTGTLRWPALAGASFFAGVAMSVSPRAVPAVVGLFVGQSLAALIRGRLAGWREHFCWFAGAMVLAAGSSLMLATWSDLWDWVFGFSRSSLPRVRLFTNASTSELLVYFAPVLVALVATSRAIREGDRNAEVAASLTPAVAVAAFGTLALAFEPRQFGQSTVLALTGALVWAGRSLALLGSPAPESVRRRSSFGAIECLVWIAAMAAIVLTVVHVARQEPQWPRTTETGTLLAATHASSGLASSIAAREILCQRFAGQTVLVEPTEFHPICMKDASYYWRGSEYLAHGTLSRADPRGAPALDLARDIRVGRPALLGPSVTEPELEGIYSGTAPLIDREYRRLEWAFVRRDLIPDAADET